MSAPSFRVAAESLQGLRESAVGFVIDHAKRHCRHVPSSFIAAVCRALDRYPPDLFNPSVDIAQAYREAANVPFAADFQTWNTWDAPPVITAAAL